MARTTGTNADQSTFGPVSTAAGCRLDNVALLVHSRARQGLPAGYRCRGIHAAGIRNGQDAFGKAFGLGNGQVTRKNHGAWPGCDEC